MSNCVAGFSFSSRATSKRTSRLTIQVGWSSPSWGRMLPAGNLARTAARSAGAEVAGLDGGGASVDTLGLLLGLLCDGVLAVPVFHTVPLAVADDLLLELEEAVDQPFGG